MDPAAARDALRASWAITPLFLALLLVEITDLVFAVDSIPAIFAITPDPFIVFTSNIFAILGLRALYFCLAALIAQVPLPQARPDPDPGVRGREAAAAQRPARTCRWSASRRGPRSRSTPRCPSWSSSGRSSSRRCSRSSGPRSRRGPRLILVRGGGAALPAVLGAASPPAEDGPVPLPPAGRPEPIERILSKWRVASRTEAQRLVRAGRVTAGGVVVRIRAGVDRSATPAVEVDGQRVAAPVGGTVWLALNKPRGVVTTTHDPEGRPTVMGFVGAHAAPGLAPVGRLDQASAGLLLLSNDDALADRLLDPRTHVRKRYRVKVKGGLAPDGPARLREDTLVEDGLALGPMGVEVESEGPKSCWLRITLDEGKNRQIRRRLADLGREVEVLVRIAIGPLELGDLSPGAVRPLTDLEVFALRSASRPRP